jgi:hypothetical protein
MRFEYKRYRRELGADIERPVIAIVLRNVRDTTAPVIAYEALIDSGSDRNIFPAELAELLGIELTGTDSVHHVGGVVAGESRPIYFHPVEIEVGGLGGPTVMTSVGFMPDLSKATASWADVDFLTGSRSSSSRMPTACWKSERKDKAICKVCL